MGETVSHLVEEVVVERVRPVRADIVTGSAHVDEAAGDCFRLAKEIVSVSEILLVDVPCEEVIVLARLEINAPHPLRIVEGTFYGPARGSEFDGYSEHINV